MSETMRQRLDRVNADFDRWLTLAYASCRPDASPLVLIHDREARALIQTVNEARREDLRPPINEHRREGRLISILPRIDLELADGRIIPGTPAAAPVPPTPPYGAAEPVATYLIPALGGCAVRTSLPCPTALTDVPSP